MSSITYIINGRSGRGDEEARPAGGRGGAMLEDRTRTLLILPQSVLDDVRVLAGKATTTLKLSVSVQIVLRALVEEGLKRDGDRGLLANIEGQAQAVRRIRSMGGRGRRQDPRSGRRRNVDDAGDERDRGGSRKASYSSG
jgi:hypothetical protein